MAKQTSKQTQKVSIRISNDGGYRRRRYRKRKTTRSGSKDTDVAGRPKFGVAPPTAPSVVFYGQPPSAPSVDRQQSILQALGVQPQGRPLIQEIAEEVRRITGGGQQLIQPPPPPPTPSTVSSAPSPSPLLLPQPATSVMAPVNPFARLTSPSQSSATMGVFPQRPMLLERMPTMVLTDIPESPAPQPKEIKSPRPITRTGGGFRGATPQPSITSPIRRTLSEPIKITPVAERTRSKTPALQPVAPKKTVMEVTDVATQITPKPSLVSQGTIMTPRKPSIVSGTVQSPTQGTLKKVVEQQKPVPVPIPSRPFTGTPFPTPLPLPSQQKPTAEASMVINPVPVMTGSLKQTLENQKLSKPGVEIEDLGKEDREEEEEKPKEIIRIKKSPDDAFISKINKLLSLKKITDTKYGDIIAYNDLFKERIRKDPKFAERTQELKKQWDDFYKKATPP